jgi:hypothetical protein
MDFDGETLTWGERTAPAAAIEGFREHFNTLTGRAWLAVEGPDWRIPIDAGYGVIRADLRRWFPDRPFTADWSDGRFPAARFGVPCDLLFGLGLASTLAASMALSWAVGPGAGAVSIAAALWPLIRLRDSVVVRDEGIRTGPIWAPMIPWHDVIGVAFVPGRRAAEVWVDSDRGSGVATIPLALLPALRGRIRRLGRLDLADDADAVDARYRHWQAPAAGIPWGVLFGTVIAAFLAENPWVVLNAGLLTMAGLAMLAAAIEARATGWGAGGVFWFTGVYATVLLALAVGMLL